ncbi:MAG: prepilin-type N-terminal cleavage/methylation domain-containing protein [Phycisphaerales bacterium]|nr:MAG: prepilin-type N-terminal cleavage/methylation domain-containing protein [Phycisphaerales bacterium]
MRRSGFTLIELLVVIAVTSLLLAVLMASLQRSRRLAKAVRCGSNVKQLVLGLALYETENQTFPHSLHESFVEEPPGGFAGDPVFDRAGWWWFNHITDYSRTQLHRVSVLWCPSRELRDPRLRRNVLCGSYGVNESVCKRSSGSESRWEFVGRPLCTGDVWRSSETLLIMDSGYSTITWWHATDAPPTALGSTREDMAYVPGLWINEDKDIWPGQELDAFGGRHPNKTVNVGFVDGHTDRVRADDLFVEKVDDVYRNQSPLWVPR